MKKVSVLIVDDSAFMRKLIEDMLLTHPFLRVVGTARDGLDGLKKAQTLRPDVITLDVEMPKMDGLEMLQQLMETQPTPVVMLSSTTAHGAANTIKAMEYGAVDFVEKPSGAVSLDIHKVKQELIDKILAASLIDLEKTVIVERPKVTPVDRPTAREDARLSKFRRHLTGKELVCIGTSTGGPRALERIISELPATLNVPIFIVQHMPAGFTKSMAERLDEKSALDVKEAENGEIAQRGTVYIAPGGFHLGVKRMGTSLVLELTQSEPFKGHRPSVNQLLTSVSTLEGFSKVVVILTGMGDDGSEGLALLKRQDPEGVRLYTIAESKESAVVFGMPKMAIREGVDRVEPIENLADVLTMIFKK